VIDSFALVAARFTAVAAQTLQAAVEAVRPQCVPTELFACRPYTVRLQRTARALRYRGYPWGHSVGML
jgi:hypothetical protein